MKNVWLFLLLLVVLVGNTVGLYVLLTSRRALQVWDLQPLWQAGRWLVERRGDPYSDEMTRLLQMQSYGRLAREGEDPRAFVYPLYALLLVLPLIFLPLPWAQAAWFTLLELGLISGVIGVIRLVGWRPVGCRVLLAVVWSFLLYPVAWALLLGQISLLIFALLVGALLALRSGRDTWAGMCLALMTAKPQMAFLIVPALFLWGWGQRRYRFVLSFVAAMGVLSILSFAVLPGWLAGTLRAGVGYFEAQPFPPPVVLLGQAVASEKGQAVAAVLVLSLLVGLGWTWWREWQGAPLPLGAISATLVVTALVAPRTSMVNQVTLLLPLGALLAGLARWRRWGKWLAVAIPIVLLIGLWSIDWLCFPPLGSGAHWHAQQRIISPVLPMLLLIGFALRFLWARREEGV